MRTRLSSIERATGIFVVAVVGTVIGASLYGGGSRRVSDLVSSPLQLHVMMDEGHGVRAGSPVLLYGVPVGAVSDIEIAPSARYPGRPVRLTLDVEADAARHLRTDTSVVIEAGAPPFVIGQLFLSSTKGDQLANHAIIPGEAKDSFISTMVNDAETMTRDSRTLMKEMSTTSRELSASAKRVSETARSMKAVSDAMSHGEGLAAALVNDGKLAKDLDALVVETRVATRKAQKVIELAAEAAADAPATSKNLKQLTGESLELMKVVRVGLKDVEKVLAAVERTVALAEELTRSLKATASYAPELARKADTSLAESKRLLNAAQKSILIRGLLPERERPPTAARVRPPARLPEGGAPSPAPRPSGEPR